MHSTQELLPPCTSALPAGGVRGGKGTGSQKVEVPLLWKFHAVLELHTELTLVSGLHPFMDKSYFPSRASTDQKGKCSSERINPMRLQTSPLE